ATVYIILKTIQIMLFAHPILSSITEPTIPTRNNLFRNYTVANFKIFNFGAFLNYSSYKFMTWYHWCFNILRLFFISPKAWSSTICFYVSCANTASFYLHNYFLLFFLFMSFYLF